MANNRLILGCAVLLCAVGVYSAEPSGCPAMLYKDLDWYDAVVGNLSNKHDMRNEDKLAAMCRALYVVITRAAQVGCSLSAVHHLQPRQRSMYQAGARACLSSGLQNRSNKQNVVTSDNMPSITPERVATFMSLPPPDNQGISGKNIYEYLEPCHLRIRNCYLQLHTNLMMRSRLGSRTCDVIESFANCLLALKHCGFSPFLKPLIVKDAISRTQFAFWEPKGCPLQSNMQATSGMVNTASNIRGPTVTTPADCSRASFKCSNGNCVGLDMVCNSVDNCGDASDEIGCQTGEKNAALEIEKTFIKYDCYDVMPNCTSLYVKPLLFSLQMGQQPSLSSLCKASNKVLQCAVHDSCPLSVEDKVKVSVLLIQSFEQLVSRKTCKLIMAANKTSSDYNNGGTTLSNTNSVLSTTPRDKDRKVLITDPTNGLTIMSGYDDTINFDNTKNTQGSFANTNTTNINTTAGTFTNINTASDAFPITNTTADASPKTNTTADTFPNAMLNTNRTNSPTLYPNSAQPTATAGTQGSISSPTVTSPCIKSCAGMPAGDYQSCKGCNMFATCSEGVLYDNRPCPAKLVWDDVSKSCDLTSTTC